MEDFEIENGVLTEYQGEDVDVIVPEGVREIGEGAFWRCDVESVRLPQGIRAIRLPEGLERIESSAFRGDIPRIVSASGAAFGCLSLRGCSHLLSLTVPAGTEVSECAFGFDEESKRLRSRLTVHYTGGTE